MNLRTYIVKALYPLCSDEVQILLDQMQNNSDKFAQIFEGAPYRTENPWYRAMQSGNFELIDYLALRQQLRLLKNKYAKQMILEGLLESNQQAENREANLNMFDSVTGAPSKIRMNRAQIDIAKKFMEAEARNQKQQANLQKTRYSK